MAAGGGVPFDLTAAAAQWRHPHRAEALGRGRASVSPPPPTDSRLHCSAMRIQIVPAHRISPADPDAQPVRQRRRLGGTHPGGGACRRVLAAQTGELKFTSFLKFHKFSTKSYFATCASGRSGSRSLLCQAAGLCTALPRKVCGRRLSAAAGRSGVPRPSPGRWPTVAATEAHAAGASRPTRRKIPTTPHDVWCLH